MKTTTTAAMATPLSPPKQQQQQQQGNVRVSMFDANRMPPPPTDVTQEAPTSPLLGP